MEVFRVLPPFLAYASTPLRLRYGEGVEARLRVRRGGALARCGAALGAMLRPAR